MCCNKKKTTTKIKIPAGRHRMKVKCLVREPVFKTGFMTIIISESGVILPIGQRHIPARSIIILHYKYVILVKTVIDAQNMNDDDDVDEENTFEKTFITQHEKIVPKLKWIRRLRSKEVLDKLNFFVMKTKRFIHGTTFSKCHL